MTDTGTPAVERVRHELRFRVATVVASERLTPRMMRIVLHSPDFADFVSLAYDDHVKLFFPLEDGTLVVPQPGPDGAVMPEGVPRPEGRDYTPRRVDTARCELTIDFVVHGDGVATRWAEGARPGDRIGVGGPRASFVVRRPFDWYLLVGDETALPAIGRRIEELPATSTVMAFIEVADAAERQTFDTPARLDVTWIERASSGDEPGAGLVRAVTSARLPDGEGYAFVAGEARMARTLQRHLAGERGFDKDRIKASGYWKVGAADFYDGHAH